ncbi:MAG: rRNA maturation RNase YbeY [Croceitalea sp.]|nr:rRNA maturation RNase YbeY [Croceitalea sp.]
MKVEYNFEHPFKLSNQERYTEWIKDIISLSGKSLGQLAYNFYDDQQLLLLNQKYLNHDTFTDILTFDYGNGNVISGDICISIDRVKENASTFQVNFEDELRRVMAHGVLHLLGYQDRTESEKSVMRKKEEELMALFHVEH